MLARVYDDILVYGQLSRVERKRDGTFVYLFDRVISMEIDFHRGEGEIIADTVIVPDDSVIESIATQPPELVLGEGWVSCVGIDALGEPRSTQFTLSLMDESPTGYRKFDPYDNKNVLSFNADLRHSLSVNLSDNVLVYDPLTKSWTSLNKALERFGEGNR